MRALPRRVERRFYVDSEQGSDGNDVDRAVQREGNCAIWPWAADNTVIQYNEVTRTGDIGDGEAYDSDYYCDGTIIQYNYSHNNPGGFLRICNGDPGAGHYNRNTVVRYNISENDGDHDDAVIDLWKRLDNCRVYGNTIRVPGGKGKRVLVGSNKHGGGEGGTNYWYENTWIVENGTTGRFQIGDGSSNRWWDNNYAGDFQTGQLINWGFWKWWLWWNGTPED